MSEFRNVAVPMPFGQAPGAAKYCNSTLVMFSPWEFSFELGQLTPAAVGPIPGTVGDQSAGSQQQQVQVQVQKVVHDWIAMSPPHAKAFLRALQDNVAQYEAQHGPIPDVQEPPPTTTKGKK